VLGAALLLATPIVAAAQADQLDVIAGETAELRGLPPLARSTMSSSPPTS
jgi:hypothetical protein